MANININTDNTSSYSNYERLLGLYLSYDIFDQYVGIPGQTIIDFTRCNNYSSYFIFPGKIELFFKNEFLRIDYHNLQLNIRFTDKNDSNNYHKIIAVLDETRSAYFVILYSLCVWGESTNKEAVKNIELMVKLFILARFPHLSEYFELNKSLAKDIIEYVDSDKFRKQYFRLFDFFNNDYCEISSWQFVHRFYMKFEKDESGLADLNRTEYCYYYVSRQNFLQDALNNALNKDINHHSKSIQQIFSFMQIDYLYNDVMSFIFFNVQLQQNENKDSCWIWPPHETK